MTLRRLGGRRRRHFEDFPKDLELDLGSVSVTRAAMVRFAREFDPQPFHVDEAAARRSHFGGLIASGWHTCALVIRRSCDVFLLDAEAAGSPGVEQVRFLQPVRPGDVLRMRVTVAEARALRSRPELGIVQLSWQVSNQRGVGVLSMKAHLLMQRRGVDPSATSVRRALPRTVRIRGTRARAASPDPRSRRTPAPQPPCTLPPSEAPGDRAPT